MKKFSLLLLLAMGLFIVSCGNEEAENTEEGNTEEVASLDHDCCTDECGDDCEIHADEKENCKKKCKKEGKTCSTDGDKKCCKDKSNCKKSSDDSSTNADEVDEDNTTTEVVAETAE